MIKMIWSNVIEQNPWWKGRDFASADRDIQEYNAAEIKVKRKPCPLQPGEVTLIKGPRRVGKTMLMKLTILNLLNNGASPRNMLYLNLDTLPSRKTKEFAHVLDRFLFDLRDNEGYIFLDEVTSLEGWDVLLKGYLDKGTFSKTAVVCTGSDPGNIEVGKRTLLGRNVHLSVIGPLNFRNYLLSFLPLADARVVGVTEKESKALLTRLMSTGVNLNMPLSDILERYYRLEPFSATLRFLFERLYLRTGGFPKTINTFVQCARQFPKKNLQEVGVDFSLYQEIIDKIVEKVGNADRAKHLLAQITKDEYLSATVSDHALAQDLLIHPSTVESDLRKMEELFIIHQVKNVEGVLKKIYFSDPFIFSSIYILDKETDPNQVLQEFFADESNMGRVVEAIVAGALFTHGYVPSLRERFLSFYRKGSKELDFVYFKRLGIEVKYRTEAESPLKISGVENYLVLSREPDIQPWKDSVLVVPTAVFLALLEAGEAWL